jgi:hypothetical protein
MMEDILSVADGLVGKTYGSALLYTFICALAAFAIEYALLRAPRPKVPRIGKEPTGVVALAKARADFFVNGRHLAEEGYSKVLLNHSFSIGVCKYAGLIRE